MNTGEDPRVSAYVMNELQGPELSAFEAELAGNPDLRGEVEAFRSASELLQKALKQHSSTKVLAPERRAVIEEQVRSRTESVRMWTPRLRALVFAVGSCAAMLLCVLTLWTLRSSHRKQLASHRRSTELLLSRLGVALKEYQADFGALPPDTGFGMAMDNPKRGAGWRYDAGSLWRYLGRSTTIDGESRGPYMNFTSEELVAYNDPLRGQSFYVADSWGTPVGYVGSPSRVIHNHGGFDLYSAGPDRKTGQDVLSAVADNFAYDGMDNNGDGVADDSMEFGRAAMNGCLTVANAQVRIDHDALDDLNNWDQRD